jgi:hypothetical protein
MSEEQLYLELYTTVKKFQMEISKLQKCKDILSGTSQPRAVVIQHVTKGCT